MLRQRKLLQSVQKSEDNELSSCFKISIGSIFHHQRKKKAHERNEISVGSKTPQQFDARDGWVGEWVPEWEISSHHSQ